MSAGRGARRPRVVLIFGNTIEHNSRAMRMAGSLVGTGAEVLLVGRAAPGLPERERRDGFEILRIPVPPGPRWLPAPRLPEAGGRGRGGAGARIPRLLREGPGRALQSIRYLLAARAWSAAIARAVPAADAWQADGLVTLPVALGLRRRRGGRVVYDALEIHVESGRFARLSTTWRRLLAWREGAWARSADAVITVSGAYADVLRPRLGVDPAIVMNCPPAPPADRPRADGLGDGSAPDPGAGASARPRRFHEMLGIPRGTPVVLYHGYLFPHRGIEQLFEAIGLVPGAHLVVMGFGPRFESYRDGAASLVHRERVHVVPGVLPEELIGWVASADVAAMPIEGNTLNHRLTTPNKLFEALAAGVPVVASDLPGMAPIVRETGAGILCDPDDPADIARAIRSLLDAAPGDRAALRERVLAAARTTYNWERQAERYLAIYRGLGVVRGQADCGPGDGGAKASAAGEPA